MDVPTGDARALAVKGDGGMVTLCFGRCDRWCELLGLYRFRKERVEFLLGGTFATALARRWRGALFCAQ